jgi:hypothetical protein
MAKENLITKTAKEILESAKKNGVGRWGEGYHDNKAFVYPDEIDILISDGARVIELNKDGKSSFIHQVRYRDHTFISATEKPYDFKNKLTSR